MEREKPTTEREVLERFAFTEEQRKLIAKHTNREVKNALIVKLSPDEARRLAPGIISAVAIDVCW